MDSDSENEVQCTPLDVYEVAQLPIHNLLLDKSKSKFEMAYKLKKKIDVDIKKKVRIYNKYGFREELIVQKPK